MEIPAPYEPGDNIHWKIQAMIKYLEADKKLRDEQFESILKAFNAAGIVLKDLVDIELDEK